MDAYAPHKELITFLAMQRHLKRDFQTRTLAVGLQSFEEHMVHLAPAFGIRSPHSKIIQLHGSGRIILNKARKLPHSPSVVELCTSYWLEMSL